MGFKDKLQQHRDQTSQQATDLALNRAASEAEKTVKLNAFIGRLDPLVKSVMEKFVTEATDAKYSAHQHFWKEEWRCWWYFAFVPTPNEEPDTKTTFGNRNQVSAILRLNSDGMITLEWHPPSSEIQLLSDVERNRELSIDDLSEQVIEKWLEDFVARMLELREAQDKARY